MENFQCGDYFFSSNFDSGNLGRVELVRKSPDTDVADNLIHAEYNVWTVPDCFGTPYENPNRTWFFFAIRGGRPYKNIRINVRNLNRQAKLFSQGMQPVVRIGPHGKWERIKEKPIYNVEIDNFTISFTHRALDKVDVEHYYAFTYPFTYTECQNMLEKFDRKYKKCVHQINYIINRLYSPEGEDKLFTSNVARGLLGNSCSSILNCDDCSDSVSDSFLNLERQTKNELHNDIYYHRELLINSIEGRRVDLLTISSFHGIENRHEETLTNVFPELGSCRAHCFKDKKIIFLSSRVHPGETPASFVLNGFLNLILDRKSGIAATLRKLYVFKIVPILNPDGVYHGLYRTDTLGHNLNRMYINPKLHTQPSIYAVKKLIKYYHLGSNKFDEDAISSDNPLLCSAKGITNIKRWAKILKNAFVEKLDCDKNKLEDKSMDLENVSSNCSSKESTSPEESENIVKLIKNTINIDKQIKSRVFMDELIPELKTITKEPAVTKILSPSIQKKFSDGKARKCNIKLNRTLDPSTSQSVDCKMKEHVATQSRNFHKKVQRKELKSSKSASSFAGSSKIIPKKNVLSSHNLNINTEILLKAHNDDIQKDRRDVDENSNMFLYIDFHGHASKKGVFMYGNHFPNVSNAIECMLLPKLMSINCHHFHYDACNFSERNMYRKEKRDGLSKEGSGRVAVYKMTGLIKSYTLESNYNTGKYVNVLPPRNKDHVARITNIVPPKYTPAIYEEVGRALGPSILDLTNSNHLSRIQNSDVRTLQGMRISLRNEIDRNYSQISSVPCSAKVKRSPP